MINKSEESDKINTRKYLCNICW